MIIKKKYKFEAAYVNENGIQGSSFEMHVSFKLKTSKEVLESVEKIADNFDHSIMFSTTNNNVLFLKDSSERKIILENIHTKNITPLLYAYLTLYSIPTEVRKFIKQIEVDDTKDTSYVIKQSDLKKEEKKDFIPLFSIENLKK